MSTTATPITDAVTQDYQAHEPTVPWAAINAMRKLEVAANELTYKLTEIQHIADMYADVDDGRPNDMMKIIAILEGQP